MTVAPITAITERANAVRASSSPGSVTPGWAIAAEMASVYWRMLSVRIPSSRPARTPSQTRM